jgi:hypothetical protein
MYMDMVDDVIATPKLNCIGRVAASRGCLLWQRWRKRLAESHGCLLIRRDVLDACLGWAGKLEESVVRFLTVHMLHP